MQSSLILETFTGVGILHQVKTGAIFAIDTCVLGKTNKVTFFFLPYSPLAGKCI